MLTSNTKNRLKVAVLLIAVSLLSFILGAKLKSKPFYVLKETDVTIEDSLHHLRQINDIMNLVKHKYVEEVDQEVLIEGAIRGMIDAIGDPYSTYMNPSEFKDFMISVDGSFEGVGLSLGYDESSSSIVVIAPIEGSPAFKAGIYPKDRIVKVDDVDLKSKNLDDAVKLMRGKKGTKVTIYVERPGVDEVLQFELVRDNIRLATVRHDILPGDIGYIKISSFDSYTSKEFKEAIDELENKGLKGIILDLRNNPGGSLQESVDVADRILGKGLIVYTEDRYKNKLEEYYSDEKKLSLPLVVLVNENSASAAEIVAGAIQDHKAGIIVGNKTYGKGSVQELDPFVDGSGIKLTIAKYYIPSGRCIDGVGIEPDIKINLPDNINPFLVPVDKDVQLKKAIEILNSSN